MVTFASAILSVVTASLAILGVVIFKSVILIVVTALSAIFAVVTFASSILVVVTASFAILAAVIFASAIFAVVTFASSILVVVTALFAILELSITPGATKGKSAVPVRSPANFILPFVVVVASGVNELAITNAVVAICVVFVANGAVGAVGTPVKLGEANGAFKSSAAWVAVEIGLFKSVVLST